MVKVEKRKGWERKLGGKFEVQGESHYFFRLTLALVVYVTRKEKMVLLVWMDRRVPMAPGV